MCKQAYEKLSEQLAIVMKAFSLQPEAYVSMRCIRGFVDRPAVEERYQLRSESGTVWANAFPATCDQLFVEPFLIVARFKFECDKVHCHGNELEDQTGSSQYFVAAECSVLYGPLYVERIVLFNHHRTSRSLNVHHINRD